jgi:hypothetical protein
MNEMNAEGEQDVDPGMLGTPICLNTALEVLAPPQGRRSEKHGPDALFMEVLSNSLPRKFCILSDEEMKKDD